MNLNATRTVGEIAAEVPQSVRVFETYGIDYCCGGKRLLEKACGQAGVAVEEVIRSIEKEVADSNRPADATDWTKASLRDLIFYIVETHHVYTRSALGRLRPLCEKVAGVHGERHPELLEVKKLFDTLYDDLVPHLMKEEQMLFPFVTMMEDAVRHKTAMPLPPFGTVQNPIRMMMMEHDTAGDILADLRRITGGYQPPADGCMSYQSFYRGLEELEQDLHRHIHLENNILFPRAAEFEAQNGEQVSYAVSGTCGANC